MFLFSNFSKVIINESNSFLLQNLQFLNSILFSLLIFLKLRLVLEKIEWTVSISQNRNCVVEKIKRIKKVVKGIKKKYI